MYLTQTDLPINGKFKLFVSLGKNMRIIVGREPNHKMLFLAPKIHELSRGKILNRYKISTR